MTLQKFSDKSFLSMFKTRLKSALLFPIIGLLFLGIYAVAGPFSEVIRLNSPDRYGYYDYISIENVKYILFDSLRTSDSGFPDRAVFMYMAVIIVAILCAIMVFRDLSNKKTANVYYSLGFSRSKLFASTYLAGAASLLGMVVIPFALSFVINMFAFGFSKELLSACIFVTSCLANVSLLAYTISAIAMTLSGMLFEGVFFSFFLNAISPIFTFSACMFSDGLLTGGGFVDANEYYYTTFENSFVSAFLGKLSFMNGLSHSAYEVDRLGCCLLTSDFDGLVNFLSEDNWTTPAFIPLLVWSVILAGVIFLSFYVFNRKKAENIGFFASSPILYRIFFGTLIVGFSSLGCLEGRMITKGLTWLYILIVLIVCLVITTLFVLILTKLSRMKFKKEFRVFGIYSLAVILFAAVFSTGFFGYQNRLPAVEKVKEVSVTSYRSDFNDYYNTQIFDPNEISSTITMGNFSHINNTYTFDKKADITDIEEIHKGLIAADDIKLSKNYKETKLGVKINIIYTLKNGKTLSRSYYRITPELIDRYLANKGIGEKVRFSLVEDLHMAIASVGDTEYYEGYELRTFYTVFSNDLTKATNVELSPEQLVALLEAYTLDIEKLSVKELLAPECKALGGIAIRKDQIVYGEWNEELGTEEFLGLTSELEYDNLLNSSFNYYPENVFVTINENMTNTVKWAKDAGIYKHFKKDYKTELIPIEAVHNNSSFIKLELSDNRNFNLLFEGRCIKDGIRDDDAYYYNEDDNYYLYHLPGSHYVNGLTEDEIRYIRDNATPFYLTTETGYFIRLSTAEAESLHATLFIPDSKLTTELRTKFAENSNKATEDVTQTGVEPVTTPVTSHYIEGTTYIEAN